MLWKALHLILASGDPLALQLPSDIVELRLESGVLDAGQVQSHSARGLGTGQTDLGETQSGFIQEVVAR